MALVKNVMVLFFFLALIEVSFGVVFEVGDFRGWTNDSNIDYKSWALTKEFRVGDTIRKLFLSLFLFITVFNIRLYLLNDWLYWRIVFSFSLDLHLIIIGGKKKKHQIKEKKYNIYYLFRGRRWKICKMNQINYEVFSLDSSIFSQSQFFYELERKILHFFCLLICVWAHGKEERGS